MQPSWTEIKLGGWARIQVLLLGARKGLKNLVDAELKVKTSLEWLSSTGPGRRASLLEQGSPGLTVKQCTSEHAPCTSHCSLNDTRTRGLTLLRSMSPEKSRSRTSRSCPSSAAKRDLLVVGAGADWELLLCCSLPPLCVRSGREFPALLLLLLPLRRVCMSCDVFELFGNELFLGNVLLCVAP